MQTSTNTKYFVAAFAATALFFAGYTFFGTSNEVNVETTPKTAVTVPSSKYIENVQPAVQTETIEVSPANGEVEADAGKLK